MKRTTLKVNLNSPWKEKNGALEAPGILLKPGVLCGSGGCILHLPETIRASAHKWNGIPVSLGHPYVDDQPVSIRHSSAIFKKHAIGQLRNARYEDDSLKADIAVTTTDPEIRKLVKECTIEAVGIGGSLLGKHFDLIIYDDLVTAENAATADQRSKLSDWYRYSLSLLEPGGEAVVVGTRYHYNDLYGQLAKGDQYRLLVRRALEDGKPIFPSRFPRERLAKLRAEQGSYIFSCQYLNEPVDDERALFRRSWLRFTDSDSLPRDLLYFTTIDPAIGETPDSDFTAIATCGMDGDGVLYVVDLIRERLSPHQLVEELFRLSDRWKPVRIGIEAVGFQATLLHYLNREMLERGVRLPVVPLQRRSGESKVLRILALQPILERGQLVVVEGCPCVEALEEELLRFPRGATDDLLDALSDQLRIAFPPQASDGIHRPDRRRRHGRTGY